MFRTLRISSVVAAGLLSASCVSASDPEEGDVPRTAAEVGELPEFVGATSAELRVVNFAMALDPKGRVPFLLKLSAALAATSEDVREGIRQLPEGFVAKFAPFLPGKLELVEDLARGDGGSGHVDDEEKVDASCCETYFWWWPCWPRRMRVKTE